MPNSTIYIRDIKTWEEFKRMCHDNGLTMSGVLDVLVHDFVHSGGKSTTQAEQKLRRIRKIVLE